MYIYLKGKHIYYKHRNWIERSPESRDLPRIRHYVNKVPLSLMRYESNAGNLCKGLQTCFNHSSVLWSCGRNRLLNRTCGTDEMISNLVNIATYSTGWRWRRAHRLIHLCFYPICTHERYMDLHSGARLVRRCLQTWSKAHPVPVLRGIE